MIQFYFYMCAGQSLDKISAKYAQSLLKQSSHVQPQRTFEHFAGLPHYFSQLSFWVGCPQQLFNSSLTELFANLFHDGSLVIFNFLRQHFSSFPPQQLFHWVWKGLVVFDLWPFLFDVGHHFLLFCAHGGEQLGLLIIYLRECVVLDLVDFPLELVVP